MSDLSAEKGVFLGSSDFSPGETPATCGHGHPESDCPSCAACAACDGGCGICPYVVSPPGSRRCTRHVDCHQDEGHGGACDD